MLPTSAGVEPATSWSPVRRRIQLSHRGQLLYLMKYHENILELWAAQDLKTMGSNSKMELARVVSLASDTPSGRPLYPYQIWKQSAEE